MFVERLGLGFIHIPKTAGNAIQEQLLPFSDWKKTTNHCHQDGVERFGLARCGGSLRKHSSLSEHLMSAQGQHQRWLYFTVVRNPIDRFVSYCTWRFEALGGKISKQNLSKLLMDYEAVAKFLDTPCDLVLHSRATNLMKERDSGSDARKLVVIALPFESLDAAFGSLLGAVGCCKNPIPTVKIRNKSDERLKLNIRKLVEDRLLHDLGEILEAEVSMYQTLKEQGLVTLPHEVGVGFS